MFGVFPRKAGCFIPWSEAVFPFLMGCLWLEDSVILSRDRFIPWSEAVFPFLMGCSWLEASAVLLFEDSILFIGLQAISIRHTSISFYVIILNLF